MSSQNAPFTKDEVAAFSSKLDQWSAALAPRERALLDVLMKLASQGLPAGSELSDQQLAEIAGGTAPQGLGHQTSPGGPFVGQARGPRPGGPR